MNIKSLILASIAAVALSVSACSYSGNDGLPKDHADNHTDNGMATGGGTNHHDDGGAGADNGKSGGANH